MRKHVALAAGIVALSAGGAASGCSGGSGTEAESQPVTTTKRVETQPRTHSVVDISQFRAAFEKAYGRPPNRMHWYGLITEMKMIGTGLNITTKLAPGSGGSPDSDVGEICFAALRVALDLGLMSPRPDSAITDAHVFGSDGVGLGDCA